MKYWTRPLLFGGLVVAVVVCLGFLPAPAAGQDRLKTMPGYEQFQKMSREIQGSFKSGALRVTWKDEGKAFEFQKDGKTYRYDIASHKTEEVKDPKPDNARPPGGRSGRGNRGGGLAPRGRQQSTVTSPDGKLKATYRDRNLWISDAKGGNESAVTTDGSEKGRIKYGTASWVYGEELYQNTAMWWSPDSKLLAFYRFDEGQVADYFLQVDQTKLQSKMNVEPYPKSGTPNPVVELLVYSVEKKNSVRVDVRDGKPFENSVVGHYVYHVSWSPDGKELLFNRTNRRQNILEFVAANPETGKCRVIVHEEWLPSWVNNAPPFEYLKDDHRFLWTSERSGWKNLYLYDLSGQLLATLTNHAFDVARVVRIDEDAGLVYYMAHDGDNPIKLQLHRVRLDGTGDKRLTDPSTHHDINAAPDAKHFIDVAQTHDTPPVTRLIDADGVIIEELAQSDLTKFKKLGLRRVELLKYKAGDGETDLYGMLHYPSNFDPNKKYPLLVTVYAGPNTNAARETFTLPDAKAEYGFLIASFDSRSADGRGKRFVDAIYQKLGVTEIDDQAAGVKSLYDRPYVDKSRVGIFGGSYGGYASIMCLLRYPDVFQAACASSPVTDWVHYDTIYTERYMWIPAENTDGYKAGSTLTYADKLKGRLMIYYGTADDNVHPNNSMQLIKKLQQLGKSFDVQVGPDMLHSGINQQRMMEFFIENLVMRASQAPAHD